MLKKLLRVSLIPLLLMLLLITIFKSIQNSNKTYDSEFLTSLSKGLDKRWKDNDKYPEESAKNYKLWVNDELDEVKDYGDKKFENDKLKELAIRYINVLKEGKEIASNFGAGSFDRQWSEIQNKRFELLLDINSIAEIPVQDKKTLDSILKSGKATKEFNRVYEILVDTFDPKNFVVEEVGSGSEKEKHYVGNFENTTGHYINYIDVTISLYDENDKRYYGYRLDPRLLWENGTKKSFEFSIPDSDTRFKYFKVYLSYSLK